MNRPNKKKGFTIVELVIVIAVIGILAAILIPTFVNLTAQANRVSNESFVKNINTQLATDEAKGNKSATATEALKKAQKMGFHVDDITPYDGNDIVWDETNDRYAIVKSDFATNRDMDHVAFADASFNPSTPLHKLWKFYETFDFVNGVQTYSIIAKEAWNVANVENLQVGFDAGEANGIASVSYVGGASAQTVTIRTNSFSTAVNIDAVQDTVRHFGNAAIVNVEKIAPKSYHENGTVGRLIIEQGHAVAEPKSIVFCFLSSGNEGTSAEVSTGATVYDEDGNDAGQDAIIEGTHDDCGAGNHDFGSQLVIDSMVYEVCKSCGYTLVRVVDFAGVETLTTMVNETGEIVNTPVETYNDSATNEEGQVISGKEEPAVESPDVDDIVDLNCNHEFEGKVTIEANCQHAGIKTYTCSKCGSQYTSVIAQLAHHYYDVAGHEHTPDETCTMCGHVRGVEVAKIGDATYNTLTDALAAVPTDGTKTTIKLVNDDAIKGNAGWTIGQTQNVVLDLNGYTLKNLVTQPATSKVINNLGTLTIIDSSDTNKDGTGTGKIFVQSATEFTGSWPVWNWATNAILNDGGTVNLYSGTIECSINGGLGYCIDSSSNSRSAKLNIYGGRLIGGNADQAIRLHFNAASLNNVFNMSGGVIESGGFWLYHNKTHYTGMCTVNITGGEINGFVDLMSNGDTSVNFSGGTFNLSKLRLRDSDTNATDNFVHISAGVINTLEGFILDDQRTSGDGGIEILPESTATVSELIPLGAKA